MLDKLNLGNPVALIIAIVILAYIILGMYDGYKKGFFDYFIKLGGFIVIVVLAYFLKKPLSVFLYTHLPFFKLGGIFEGVSSLNIVIYELIAFIAVFIVLYIIYKVICLVTNVIDKLVNKIPLIGLPNKLLGLGLGFLRAILTLYFVVAVIKIGSNFFGYQMVPSAADYITKIPIVKKTFGATIDSLEEITKLAKEYENTQDKEEFDMKVLEILNKYALIDKENIDVLIDEGKIKLPEGEEK